MRTNLMFVIFLAAIAAASVYGQSGVITGAARMSDPDGAVLTGYLVPENGQLMFAYGTNPTSLSTWTDCLAPTEAGIVFRTRVSVPAGKEIYYQARQCHGQNSGKVASIITPVLGTPFVTGVGPAGTTVDTLVPGSLHRLSGGPFTEGKSVAAITPLPNELDGIQVQANGVSLPLVSVDRTEIFFQVPPDFVPGLKVKIRVLHAHGALPLISPDIEVAVSDVEPAAFGPSGLGSFGTTPAFNSKGNAITSGNPLTTDADGVQRFSLATTGLGIVEHQPAAGEAAPVGPQAALSRTFNEVTVECNGQPGQVTYAGLMPGTVGLYQVNVENRTPVLGYPVCTLKVRGKSATFFLWAR